MIFIPLSRFIEVQLFLSILSRYLNDKQPKNKLTANILQIKHFQQHHLHLLKKQQKAAKQQDIVPLTLILRMSSPVHIKIKKQLNLLTYYTKNLR